MRDDETLFFSFSNKYHLMMPFYCSPDAVFLSFLVCSVPGKFSHSGHHPTSQGDTENVRLLYMHSMTNYMVSYYFSLLSHWAPACPMSSRMELNTTTRKENDRE